MLNNAADLAQYALMDINYGSYPILTGLYFAGKVKTGGAWDYKRIYQSPSYKFNGRIMKGEDLGNMHYGFVGRGGGFSEFLLSTAAGAYQIYSGTSHIGWYRSYFDDPNDQAMIRLGFGYWKNGLPTVSRSLAIHSSNLYPSLNMAEIQYMKDLSQILSDMEVKQIEENFIKDYQSYFNKASVIGGE